LVCDQPAFLIQAGRKVTEEFYHGGFEADQNILESVSLEGVASIFLSAQDIMHNNVLNNETTAILSYDWPMRNFYKFAQQLEMESNGKQVTQEGEKVGYQTNPIIWGGYGPESQHSFYQQIFQGTKDMNLYFLAAVNNEKQLNTAQYFGQAQSLVEGTTENEILYKQVNKRRFTTIELSEINARTLGNLIATWENKTILNSLIWNINAFDQWGVELGKTNTKKYLKR
jgi:glucose-6-phosphate isomerase